MIINVNHITYFSRAEVTLAHKDSAIVLGLLDVDEAQELMDIFKYAIEDLQDFLDSRKVK